MFKNRLKEILIEKNISQKEMAQKLGITDGEISHWINGRREIKAVDVLTLCKALDITPNRFFGIEDEISEQDRQLLQAFKAMAANTSNEAQAQNPVIQTTKQEKER